MWFPLNVLLVKLKSVLISICVLPRKLKWFHTKRTVTHFVDVSILLFFSKKIRLCAWDLFGPGNDMCIYNHVESRVTRNIQPDFYFFFTKIFFSYKSNIPLKVLFFCLTSQIFWLNKYLWQSCAQYSCLNAWHLSFQNDVTKSLISSSKPLKTEIGYLVKDTDFCCRIMIVQSEGTYADLEGIQQPNGKVWGESLELLQSVYILGSYLEQYMLDSRDNRRSYMLSLLVDNIHKSANTCYHSDLFCFNLDVSILFLVCRTNQIYLFQCKCVTFMSLP